MIERDLDNLLRRTRKVVEDVIAPAAVEVDREAKWPHDGLRALQSAGLGGLVVPAPCGGLDHGLYGLIRVCEEIGRECASTAMCFGMHHVAAAVIATKRTPHLDERYLKPIARGDHLTSLALSEPGSGAHFYLPQTRLTRSSNDSFLVDGHKGFVTNGGFADSYVVSTVAAESDAPPGLFSCVVVPNKTEGMRWGAPWRGFGMRGNSSRNLDLEGVPIPRDNLIGDEGDQIWYVFHVIAPYFLAAMAGAYLGIALRAVDEARDHVQRRAYEHSGSGLGDESIVQHRLGTLWSRVEQTRRFAFWAAEEYDHAGPEALPAILSSKAEVADCVVEVVNEALTLTGGIGYREGSTLHRLLRDARASHVMSPTTDILRMWTGRVLLDQPILGR